MMLGSYSGILSLKRRTAIPKKFLEELGSSVIIAKWYERCLIIVGIDTWRALLSRITGESRIITEPGRDTDRFILGSAFELTPDNQGRVVIPTALITYAKIVKNITFLGLGDRIEVWSKEDWEEREGYIASHAGKLLESIADKNGNR